VYIECYLLTELLNSPSHYLPFQAYSFIAGHFCWTFRTCSLVVLYTFPLCLVSAPKLWIYMNSCIKTIQLYYEVDFVINVALNSDWVRISLGSYRYGILEGNLAYVPVMDPEFGSWHFHLCLLVDRFAFAPLLVMHLLTLEDSFLINRF